MTDDYDFEKLFAGLTPDEAEQLANRIRTEILAGERNTNMTQGIIDALRGTGGTKEWYEQHRPEPQPLDLEGTNRQIETLAEEMQQLMKNPNKPGVFDRMSAIGREVENLEGYVIQDNQRRHDEYMQGFAPELSKLDADINSIVESINTLSKAGGNLSKIEQLSRQLDERTERKAQIEGGSAFTLKWRDPNG
jgi:hypothetical protein